MPGEGNYCSNILTTLLYGCSFINVSQFTYNNAYVSYSGFQASWSPCPDSTTTKGLVKRINKKTVDRKILSENY